MMGLSCSSSSYVWPQFHRYLGTLGIFLACIVSKENIIFHPLSSWSSMRFNTFIRLSFFPEPQFVKRIRREGPEVAQKGINSKSLVRPDVLGNLNKFSMFRPGRLNGNRSRFLIFLFSFSSQTPEMMKNSSGRSSKSCASDLIDFRLVSPVPIKDFLGKSYCRLHEPKLHDFEQFSRKLLCRRIKRREKSWKNRSKKRLEIFSFKTKSWTMRIHWSFLWHFFLRSSSISFICQSWAHTHIKVPASSFLLRNKFIFVPFPRASTMCSTFIF